MKILTGCKAILAALGLGPHRLVRCGCVSIPRICIQGVMFVSQLAFIATQFLICKRHFADSNLLDILFPGHLVLLFASRLLIYVTLVLKIGKFAEIIDCLQAVINERNCSRFFVCAHLRLSKHIFRQYDPHLTLTGCRRSSKSYAIYQKRNAMEWTMVEVICCTMQLFSLLAYVTAALSVLSNSLFGLPATESLAAPLNTEKA